MARRVAVWCVLIAMLAVSCSGDNDTAERFAALDEQAEELAGADGPVDLTEEQVSCVSEASGLSVSALVAVVAGSTLNPENQGDGAKLMNAYIECVPEDALVDVLATNLSAGLGIEVSESDSRCLFEFTLENAEDPGDVLWQAESEDSMMTFLAGLETCLDDDTISAIQGAPGTGPQQLGDDSDLDALAEDCEDENDRACDLLYLESPVGSEYEEIAAGCTLASLTTLCSGLPITLAGVIDMDSPEVRQLAQDCIDGDMIACDLTFLLAEFGSELERVGSTCGDRIVNVLPNCRTRFG